MYNIENISKLSGLSRRAIHYYVQRGVAPPPEGSGRGSYYTDEHLAILQKIKRWNDQGMPLFRMKEILEGKMSEPETNYIKEEIGQPHEIYERQLWQRHLMAPGLELHILDGLYPGALIQEIHSAVAKLLEK